ncbi:MAG TPA: hypothetical protein VFM02_01075 [Candidatus Paceibacterota bacterium]|nr:hypothetical protein [Candidatus Paceibacterota bacterium]
MGIGDPAELDLSEPEVQKAHELYYKWISEGDKKERCGEAQRRHDLDKTMVNIDAGFTGKLYLENACDWIMQDAEKAGKIPGDNERSKTRDLLAKAIRKVRRLLKEEN